MNRPFVPVFLLEDGAHALCSETDPEAYFPEPGQPNKSARDVCARCDLRNPCAQWAIANPDEHGIWGGLSERERVDIRRRQPIERRQPRNWTDAETRALVIDLTVRGWSLVQIAREVGVTARTISRIRARERDAA